MKKHSKLIKSDTRLKMYGSYVQYRNAVIGKLTFEQFLTPQGMMGYFLWSMKKVLQKKKELDSISPIS